MQQDVILQLGTTLAAADEAAGIKALEFDLPRSPWQWALYAAVLVLVLFWVVSCYRRDAAGLSGWWKIWLPALRLAAFARRHGGLVQLGCMVGETSILSAAGWRFLQMTPGVTFAEGCFGSFLLRGDVASRPLRFGFGGRGVTLSPVGLGVDVAADRLVALCPGQPTVLEL